MTASIYVETKVRPSEVCDFFSENVPKINKKRDFYVMNARNPFHRVKLSAFPKNGSRLCDKNRAICNLYNGFAD